MNEFLYHSLTGLSINSYFLVYLCFAGYFKYDFLPFENVQWIPNFVKYCISRWQRRQMTFACAMELRSISFLTYYAPVKKRNQINYCCVHFEKLSLKYSSDNLRHNKQFYDFFWFFFISNESDLFLLEITFHTCVYIWRLMGRFYLHI